jgi:hypothetical protein
MVGYPDIALRTNLSFFTQYRGVRAKSGHLDLPVTGDAGWSPRCPQLAELATTIT